MTIPAIYSSTALNVAADTAYDAQSDAYDGSSVKVEPSTGALAQGLHRPGRQLAAQNVNWLEGQFALILTQLIADTAAQDVRLDADDVELANHEGRLVSIEGWIEESSPRLRIYEFLVSGTLLVPPRVVTALGYGCGGGGAGGGGKQGTRVVNNWAAGGAGGAGALASMQVIGNPTTGPLIPGTTINIDIGIGGIQYEISLGGTGGDGGDSKVRYGTQVYAQWLGAQGGRGAVGGHNTSVNYSWATFPGMPVRGTQILLIGNAGQGIRWDMTAGGQYGTTGAGTTSFYFPMQPAMGGYGGAGGQTLNTAAPGSYNPIGGFAPGAAGGKSLDGSWADGSPLGTNTTRRGGGGGGGGGAGPFGPGGAGGNGQVGDDSDGGSIVPTEGANAGPNTGAGGGGGGSGGYEDDIDNVGGNNDNFAGGGGSGRVYIMLVLESS